MANPRGFRGYRIGMYFTCGAPAGSKPPKQQRYVIVDLVTTFKEAMDELGEVARTAQHLQEALNAQALLNHTPYVPLPALGWFVEPVYATFKGFQLVLRRAA